MDKENINYGKNELEKQEAFLESISTKIIVYKSDVQAKIDRLTYFEQIRKEKPGEFLAVEREYVNLNFELSKYISGANLPYTYFTQASNDKLDSLISKTEDILRKLNN